MKNFDTYFYNSASFLKFIESAVLSRQDFCIEYYHKRCGICSCRRFKRELNKYSDKVIITGLNELLKRESETYYINLIRNKDENYSRWDQYRFEDAIGLCLDKISEKIPPHEIKISKNIEGTPLGNFHDQKIGEKIVEGFKYSRVQKIEARQKLIKQEKEKIEAKKRHVEHLNRIEKYEKRSKGMEI